MTNRQLWTVALSALLAAGCTQSVPEATQFASADAGSDAVADIATDAASDAAGNAAACSPANCDDGNPCTTDSCKAGACSHPNANNGANCGAFKTCKGGNCQQDCGKGFLSYSVDDGKGLAKVCVAEYPVWGNGPVTPAGLKNAGDGTVTDPLSGLQWQQQTGPKLMNWDDAAAFCNTSLVLAGKADWRLPSRAELESLVDFNRGEPAIDPKLFPATPQDRHWTAVVTYGAPKEAWGIDFAMGFCSSDGQANARAVRCVRGQVAPPASTQRFEVNQQAGTARDTATQLTWQRDLDTSGGDDGQGRRNWLHAKPYCAGLTLAGGGWRLPNIRELRSLTDSSVDQPTIDHAAFPATPNDGVWSETASAKVPTSFWYVHYLDGFSDVDDLAVHYRVRCVR